MTTRRGARVGAHISQLVRDLCAAGGEIHRDGGNLLIDGPPTAALFVAALRANATELAAHVVPRVTPEEAATVRMLLSDAGVGIAYITDPQHCHIFDMRFVAWSDIAPLFNLPLAIFNATFEVKRLMHEAKIEPAGRIYDVMTAIRTRA